MSGFSRDDSYERELRDYGFSQRERRVDRHSRRDDASPQSQIRTNAMRTNSYRQDLTSLSTERAAHGEQSDAESVCSERSEHSSNRRFFRLHQSRSPSTHSTDNSKRRRPVRRSASRSPSNPTSPATSDVEDQVEGALRSRMRRRSSIKQSSNAAKRRFRLSDSDTLSSIEKTRRNSGPHTPEDRSPANSKPSSPVHKNSLATPVSVSSRTGKQRALLGAPSMNAGPKQC